MYNTEEIISLIAKAIETIPRDVSSSEISSIINDALAHMVVEPENVIYFSNFIVKSFIDLYNQCDEIAYNIENEHGVHVPLEVVQEILTIFNKQQHEMLQTILVNELQKILTQPIEENTDNVDNE